MNSGGGGDEDGRVCAVDETLRLQLGEHNFNRRVAVERTEDTGRAREREREKRIHGCARG